MRARPGRPMQSDPAHRTHTRDGASSPVGGNAKLLTMAHACTQEKGLKQAGKAMESGATAVGKSMERGATEASLRAEIMMLDRKINDAIPRIMHWNNFVNWQVLATHLALPSTAESLVERFLAVTEITEP